MIKLLTSFTLALFVFGAAAVDYPARPIRMIVPQAPGSASDNVARLLAGALTQQLGQQIVVDNRPGGALMIGMEMTARAVPDGYTIGYGPIGALAISPNIVRGTVTVDVQKDLQPISQTTTGHMLLAASPATPFKSVRELIDYAKQNPGKLSNASSGNGTPGHVGFELFKYMTGTNIVHVPYKGGAAGITDLIAGQVQLMMESLNSITPFAKSGRVRGLAVTGAARSAALPELPTIAEAGVPGYEATTWTGIVAPVGVPKPIVAKLNVEINKAIATQSLKDKFAQIGSESAGGTPEQFGALIRRESAKWAEVVKRSGAKVD
ncbi:MAG TPA: tripartite tricarboxylate transporter substrate binding protein [Burkholderiales bacterium]|jgi:tripartite-type tricarboxylate transporter receptor subunit TctC|nr:tripartite tricarboxylate transporter substrate binding protein [Burkholderiales bacterium]